LDRGRGPPFHPTNQGGVFGRGLERNKKKGEPVRGAVSRRKKSCRSRQSLPCGGRKKTERG